MVWPKIGKNFQKALVVAIFLLGIFLRGYGYQYYPFTGHLEEYLFAWSGLSLIEDGVPVSWNDLPVYPDETIIFTGKIDEPKISGELYVRFLKPWLDEPPLYSVIVGAFAKLYGLKNFTILSPYVIRLPSLIFSLATMILLFLVGKKLLGYWPSILGLLFYSVTPTIVFGNRLSVPENMITTLFLASLLLILNYFKTKKDWQKYLSIFLAGIAGLAKPTGWFLVAFIAFFVYQKRKNIKEAISLFVIGSLIFWVPFLAYGAYYNWDLFLKVISFQGTRPAGWSGLAYILTNPGFGIDVFLDGFIVFGFLSTIYLAFKRRTKGEEILLLAFVFSILIAAFSGGKHDQLAWYRYPIYPFLSLSSGLMFREIFKKPHFASSFIAILLLMANVDLLENPFWKGNPFIQSTPFRIIFTLSLLPVGFLLIYKKKSFKKLSQAVLMIVLILAVFFSSLVVATRFKKLCSHTACSLPEKVNLLKPVWVK